MRTLIAKYHLQFYNLRPLSLRVLRPVSGPTCFSCFLIWYPQDAPPTRASKLPLGSSLSIFSTLGCLKANAPKCTNLTKRSQTRFEWVWLIYCWSNGTEEQADTMSPTEMYVACREILTYTNKDEFWNSLGINELLTELWERVSWRNLILSEWYHSRPPCCGNRNSGADCILILVYLMPELPNRYATRHRTP